LPGYFHNVDHVSKDFPKLLKKWEEKIGHLNMVTTKPCEYQNPKEEVDVWVVTQGGIYTRIDLD
jgi:hypothetical protein